MKPITATIVQLTPELMRATEDMTRYVLLTHGELTAEALPILKLLRSAKATRKGFDVYMTVEQATSITRFMTIFVSEGNQARIDGRKDHFMETVEAARSQRQGEAPVIPSRLEAIRRKIRGLYITLAGLFVVVSTVARHSMKVHRILRAKR